MVKTLNDRMCVHDGLDQNIMDDVHSGLWARTEIIAGYGDKIKGPDGKTTLGEVIFRKSNIVPLGGVQYVMQRVFDAIGDDNIYTIKVPTLYDQAGIGLPNSAPITEDETYQIPSGTSVADKQKIQYRHGHRVCVFGIGNTGAENDVTVYQPDYRENRIDIVMDEGTSAEVKGVMIPFRVLGRNNTLSETERKQYFGKKEDGEGNMQYFLKTFNSAPVIHHIYKTGDDVEIETPVDNDSVWVTSVNNNPVESFTEVELKISKKDVKEYFFNIGQPDRARINTVALFTGRYVCDDETGSDFGDFEDVMLFSKLCFNTEYLTLSKDLTILYRVYGA